MEQSRGVGLTIDQYITGVRTVLDQLPVDRIQQFIALLHRARLSNNQVFIMGNGGSATTASHFVCDLAKNTRRDDMPGFRVIGLSDNMAIFSALANDEGYENVFSQQLRNLLQPNDVVIAISASGNSPNVLRAVELADQFGAVTVGMTGFDGGKLGRMVHLEIRIPSYQIQQVEDLHLMLEHMVSNTLTNIQPDLESEIAAVEVPGLITSPDQIAFSDIQGIDHTLDTQRFKAGGAINNHVQLREVLEEALGSTGAMSGTLIMLNSVGKVVYGLLMRNGQVENARVDQLSDVIQSGLAGWVVRNRKAALVGNTTNDPRWLRRNWENHDDPSRSALSLPLTSSENVVGTLTLIHQQPHRFTLQDLARLTNLTKTITPEEE